MKKQMKIEEVDVNMKGNIVHEKGFIYFNPKEDKHFSIEGLAFFDKEKEYFRLPIDCKDKVTEAVYWLSSHPSGGQIRFQTNAKQISVKIKNKGDYQMCHMAATGQQGVDIYYRLKGQKNYTFFNCAKFVEPTSEFESIIFQSDEMMDKDIIINLPLYEGLEEILIGLNEEATLKAPKKRKKEGRVVIYGTSVTQGGCASRPGMSFTNILSRKLDMEFINLGFSGSGLGEPNVARLINEISDIRLLILDYEANGGATGDLYHNMEEFIDIFRSLHPQTPILIMSKHPFSCYIFSKEEREKRQFYLNFQSEVVRKRKEKGDDNIYFMNGNLLFGSKDIYESCVDGLHPTDLGFYRIATTLYPILKKILNKQ